VSDYQHICSTIRLTSEPRDHLRILHARLKGRTRCYNNYDVYL